MFSNSLPGEYIETPTYPPHIDVASPSHVMWQMASPVDVTLVKSRSHRQKFFCKHKNSLIYQIS